MRFAIWPDVVLSAFWLAQAVSAAITETAVPGWIFALVSLVVVVKCWETISLKRLCGIKQDLIETQREYYTMLERER